MSHLDPADDQRDEAYEDQAHTSPTYLAPLGTSSNCMKHTIFKKNKKPSVYAGTWTIEPSKMARDMCKGCSDYQKMLGNLDLKSLHQSCIRGVLVVVILRGWPLNDWKSYTGYLLGNPSLGMSVILERSQAPESITKLYKDFNNIQYWFSNTFVMFNTCCKLTLWNQSGSAMTRAKHIPD